METERNQQRNQDGVRDGDSAAKRMEERTPVFSGRRRYSEGTDGMYGAAL
ncbi:MAG: hypothetical protein ACLTBV_31170 [Enterocloster bolteae]